MVSLYKKFKKSLAKIICNFVIMGDRQSLPVQCAGRSIVAASY